MNLSTRVYAPKSKIEILPSSKIMTIGSCFSVHMGNKLSDHNFLCLSNPFGTIFNPCSIAKLLSLAMKGIHTQDLEIEVNRGRYFNYDFHSSYDANSADLVKEKIQQSIIDTNTEIQSLDILIVTFGTSIGYRHIEKDRLVSNCHKVPNNQFQRHFIEDDLMFVSMAEAINSLRSIRPGLHIVFTVSPVRHTKEGLVDNNKSKSKLIQLSHKLVDYFDNTSYFPSYEIMMDELRGYRFYKEDMIHPSSQAVDIIWSRFIETYFSSSAIDKAADFKKLNQAVNHRPFDAESENHRKFIVKQQSIISELRTKYPEVDFEKYEHYFVINE